MAVVSFSPACRELRRQLGALGWAVLEDVVLDAELTDFSLCAATSARQVAAHLGITPGTAAVALRRLRKYGLVKHRRLEGTAGRFGLSVYEVVVPEGMAVAPCPASPDMVTPHVANQLSVHEVSKPLARPATRRRAAAGAVPQLSLITEDDER